MELLSQPCEPLPRMALTFVLCSPLQDNARVAVPLSRRCRACPPELQQIVERAFERNLGAPAELRRNSRVIADDEGDVVGPVSSRVDANADGDSRARQQHIQQVANRNRATGTHVVRAAPY